jgi:hypothetical protein
VVARDEVQRAGSPFGDRVQVNRHVAGFRDIVGEGVGVGEHVGESPLGGRRKLRWMSVSQASLIWLLWHGSSGVVSG